MLAARLAILLPPLRAVDGYLGLLLFGSFARGTAKVSSDLDLVVVTERPIAPERVHSSRVDVNFLTESDVRAVAARVAHAQGLPWDTMFEQVTVADDRDGVVAALAKELEQAFATAARAAEPEVAALRFLILRRIAKLRITEADDVIRGQLRLLAAVACICAAHEGVSGRPWHGLDAAFEWVEEEAAAAAAELRAAVDAAPDWPAAVHALEAAAAIILAPAGGPWSGSPLTLSAGLPREETTLPTLRLPAGIRRAVDDALRDL